MEKMIHEIMESGLLRYAIDAQLAEDAVYEKDMQDAKQLNLYLKKMISEEQGMVLDDYEAIMQSASARAQELAYIVGMRDTIAYLQQKDALKTV